MKVTVFGTGYVGLVQGAVLADVGHQVLCVDVDEKKVAALKAGQIPFEGSLDLHGMSVEKARGTLWEFLAEAGKFEIRCVRVTHGKAARVDGKRPLIKSHVNTWLRQHPQVLGFTSCLAKHGGTGALYVMLKRTMLEGRDE